MSIDKEKQIEEMEMAREIYEALLYCKNNNYCRNCEFKNNTPIGFCKAKYIATVISKKYQLKSLEDNIVNTPTIQCETYSSSDMVVISREEYEKLLKLKEEASIKEINYFSNLFKLQKEVEQVEKERDSARGNCDRKSKELVQKIYYKAEKKAYFQDGGYYDKDRYSLDMEDLKEILKQLDLEIKE